MITNKEIIRRVNEGFAEGDTEKIMQYVADDVRWDIPGFSSAIGKDAFRKEIRNENFEGVPVITVRTELMDGDYVAVEGSVQSRKKGGDIFEASFFDIYRLENGKIKEMRSYVIPLNR